ncbi:hypothetical protein [Paraburkholderia heleia]|uniref:hypothetical protein n=1 Tax=Paraburkholderia heleia TaxID=634127 RepID=UPI002AB72B4B|nr:hypothetical protein [Paraburkholderia heleia]
MSSLRLQAPVELLRRYTAGWRAGWTIRDRFDAPARTRYEFAFQPAHLELVETTVHTAPRWTAYIVAALIALTIVIFARLNTGLTFSWARAIHAPSGFRAPGVTLGFRTTEQF